MMSRRIQPAAYRSMFRSRTRSPHASRAKASSASSTSAGPPSGRRSRASCGRASSEFASRRNGPYRLLDCYYNWRGPDDCIPCARHFASQQWHSHRRECAYRSDRRCGPEDRSRHVLPRDDSAEGGGPDGHFRRPGGSPLIDPSTDKLAARQRPLSRPISASAWASWPHGRRSLGHGHGRHHGGARNPQLLADLAKLFIGDRFPPCELMSPLDQRPRIEESNPAPPPVAVVTDEISAVAPQMQPDRRAVLWRLGHWGSPRVVTHAPPAVAGSRRVSAEKWFGTRTRAQTRQPPRRLPCRCFRSRRCEVGRAFAILQAAIGGAAAGRTCISGRSA